MHPILKLDRREIHHICMERALIQFDPNARWYELTESEMDQVYEISAGIEQQMLDAFDEEERKEKALNPAKPSVQQADFSGCWWMLNYKNA